jgi:hypothetical protein
MQSNEKLARLYHKGQPSALTFAADAVKWHAQGCRVQVLNEPNHPIEQFHGGIEGFVAFWNAVAGLAPGARLYWPGMSPGIPGWESWYLPARMCAPKGIATHAYGTLDQMREVVVKVRALTGGLPQWIAECNFGAGQQVDRDAWARDHLKPFLDWCAQQPDVEAVTYFAYRWPDPDMPLPTPVDGTGTEIERVLREFKAPDLPETPPVVVEPPTPPPPPGGTVDTYDQWSMPKRRSAAHPENYSAARRPKTVGVVVHSTAGTSPTLAKEFIGTVNWFQNPEAGVSAHAVVGPTEVAACVPEDEVAWHARANNNTHLGLELAWPDTPVYGNTEYLAKHYEHAGELIARWAKKYGFPLRWVATQTAPGLILHKESEAGKADGKRDPTGLFDKNALLDACNRWSIKIGGQPAPPAPPVVDPVTDAINGVRHHLLAAAYAADRQVEAVAAAKRELDELVQALGR